jgi:biotin carboxylase
MRTPEYVGVVDAFSSGSDYAAELRARGYQPVHVQREVPVPADDRSTFAADLYAANLTFDGDLDRCARALAAFQPRCVLAGSEHGVELADQLSEALGLPGNGTALSAARRDKLAMQRAIAAAGLRSIPSQTAARWDTIEAWVSANLPVVVKPRASAGTDGVFLCDDLAQARHAFESIVGRNNVLGVTNDEVLVQTAIEGTEYNVNFVSREGRHRLTDIWRIDKLRGRHPLYDRGVVLPCRGEVQDQLVPYVAAVLDTLGIRFGPSHADVMWTSTGPVLIEVGARLHGQSVQPLCEVVTGVSQLKVALDAYLAPERFAEPSSDAYALHRHLQRVELISPRAGTLRALRHLDEIRALPSFYGMKLLVEVGRPIAHTTDLLTIPGYVDLIHADPAVVESDHQRLRAWERDDLYDIVAT